MPAKREPKWRNAMSEMLPADTPGVASALPSLPAIATTGMNWLDRWVDVAQVAPPSFLRRNAGARRRGGLAGRRLRRPIRWSRRCG